MARTPEQDQEGIDDILSHCMDACSDAGMEVDDDESFFLVTHQNGVTFKVSIEPLKDDEA